MNIPALNPSLINNIDWSLLMTFFSGIGIGSILSVLLIFYLKRQREEEVKRREASVAVADLLSEWIRSTYLNVDLNEAYWRLQSLYWKTILRLDKRILDVLLPRLANKKEAINTNEIIIKCRQTLLELKDPDLKPEELNNWLPLEKNKRD